MDLMHNSCFRIQSGPNQGIYRVVLNEPLINKIVAARLDAPTGGAGKGGRRLMERTASPRKKRVPPLINGLTWMDRETLIEDLDGGNALVIEIVPTNPRPRSARRRTAPQSAPTHPTRAQTILDRRVQAAQPFLTFDLLREHILTYRGIGTLVREATSVSGLSEACVRRVFSLLCRFGFSERSLRVAYENCGAPGVQRPCDPGGRKKAGRKTTKERHDCRLGVARSPDQPGMSTQWRDRILAADLGIPTPKPPMPQRILRIYDSAFVQRYEYENGRPMPCDLPSGGYPNRRQVRRVLEVEIPALERVRQATTEGHFERCLRGMRGRSWRNVAGPGHTWEIDSTVGDIYLCSAINRSWIIGRPIVYVLVDAWSTAVVGFYVCLCGPSWDMAKLAIFSAAANPNLIGELWGYAPVPCLNPTPTLPAVLLCDRGEYLSRGASYTGMKILPCLSYTPPYRPDWKSMVEVLHRIGRDEFYHFTPGSINAKRPELELRRFNPRAARLTVREFVHLLYSIFLRYNLTANRENRLDAHMKGDGVIPSPAGLWRWGHEVGIGFQRSVPESELIASLLPTARGRVGRAGVKFGTRNYQSEFIDEANWAAQARTLGGWDLDCMFYPGSVSRIWTPNPSSPGLQELSLSDQSTASPELTVDEVVDAHSRHLIGNQAREHQANLDSLSCLEECNRIVKEAQIETAKAIEDNCDDQPTMREARQRERDLDYPPDEAEARPTPPTPAATAYIETMQALLHQMNNGGDGNA